MMKKTILFCTLTTLLSLGQLLAQGIPTSGKFRFTESLGETAGGTGIFYTHSIQIKNATSALYSVDGYHASCRLECKLVKISANKVQLIFDYFGELDMFKSADDYKKGQKLLTLESQNSKWLVKYAKNFPMDQKGKTIEFKKVE